MDKKVLFLIPDGVGIRNYLYSSVITHLKNNSKIAFWSTLPEEAFEETFNLHQINVEFKKIKLHSEGFYTRLWKEASVFARLKYNSHKLDNPTILNNWRKNNKNFKLRQLYNFAEIIGNWASKKYERILNLEEKSKNGWSRDLISYYKKELKESGVSSIFITHQRVGNLMPICIAAKQLGIKVTTAIYSWDNLPKARLAVLADQYLVWSDYMKEEMKIYYPEIHSSKVIVSGTPQFEFYSVKEKLVSRSDFALKYNLDANKKWICFSGDDKTTSPYDANYLQDMAISIQNFSNDYHILFRRSPADFSDRYDSVLKDYKELITSVDPVWNTTADGWGTFFPKLEDVDLLVNMAYHCFVAVNVGSTIAHDFSVFDKPCIYINYDQKFAENWSVNTIYKFQHFRSMDGLDAVVFVNSFDEWQDKLIKIAQNPDIIAVERNNWRNRIIMHPLDLSSKLIVNSL